jgi:hypothetical protein
MLESMIVKVFVRIEVTVLDHYAIDRETHKVVLSVNEIGKTPYRVVLETKIVKCEKEKQDGNY